MKVKFKLILAVLAICLSAEVSVLSAQNIKGNVTDSQKQPLPGVSVFFKGTTTGTATDANGNYSVSNAQGAKTLVFSCLGMKDQEVVIGSRVVINVTMEEDVNYLNETVVIGYSTVQRKDLMGAVSSADSKAVTSIPAANFSEALAGKMAGVHVAASEGDPDSPVQIKVRGTGSITQDSSPLYIVDGFPVKSIADISARDIKSIDVLKDAFSTAIYGSRGAYGVVLITTKDGASNNFSVSYDGYFGWKKMANADAIEMCSPYEFAKFNYEYAVLSGPSSPTGKADDYYEPYFGSFDDIDYFKTFEGNNWRKYLFGNTGVTQNHNVNVSGRSQKGWWTASYNRMDEDAIMQMSNFSRNNLSFKGGVSPLKNLNFTMNARYSSTRFQGAGANSVNDKGSTAGNGRLINALRYAPIPMNYLRDVDDYDVYADYFGCNPERDIADNDDNRYRENWNISGAMTWTIVKNLKLKLDGGMDTGLSQTDRFYGLSSYYTRMKANPVGLPNTDSKLERYKNYRSTNTLSYNFAEVLRIKSTNLTHFSVRNICIRPHIWKIQLPEASRISTIRRWLAIIAVRLQILL